MGCIRKCGSSFTIRQTCSLEYACIFFICPLFQGDVGCGKTIVAFLACMEVMDSGYQVNDSFQKLLFVNGQLSW